MAKKNIPLGSVQRLFLVLFLAVAFFFHPIESNAVDLHSPSEILQIIESEEFRYVDRALLFGYYSIESCVYVSSRVVVVEHYCFPDREYPARSLSLWSHEFGLVELYEEDLGNTLKRDYQQSEFPGALDEFLPQDLQSVHANTISSIMEKMYTLRNPACWATNYDWYSQGRPSVGCFEFAETELPNWWGSTALGFTQNENAWKDYFDRILSRIGAGSPLRIR